MAQGIKGLPRPCSIPGCNRPHKGYGLCKLHLDRKRSFGDPNIDLSIDGRFWAKVDKGSQPPCWLWTGTTRGPGYGMYRRHQAHRWAYERFVGPIPDGLQVHHTCRNKGCVNPDHLQLVTPKEHVRLDPFSPFGINAKRTHCAHGHPFDEENTYHHPNGTRKCRTCVREAGRRWKAKQKERAR